MIYFITGNANKFKEVKSILRDVEQLDIDLIEIQEIDAHAIIKAKLQAAFEHHQGPFIVEDTSLYLDCMNGLPGPLIKWFMQTIGKDGLHKICSAYGDFGAQAKTIIGYAKDSNSIKFFEGVIKGMVVSTRGNDGFGWDPVFMPEGYDQSFAELGPDIKNKVSMRRIAIDQLAEHIKGEDR